MPNTSLKQKITLILFGIFLCIILLELGLRLGGFIFLSLQERRNRISIMKKGTYRIITLGESTTAIGGKDSYPRQLEEILNQRDTGIKFSVINKGMHGIITTTIVAQLEDNLNKYHPDMVITMIGINDGEYAIAYEDGPVKKLILSLQDFRTYKLAKLFYLHIVNKAKETGIYKPGEKKENITVRADDLPSSRNEEQEIILKKAIEINPENDQAYFQLGRCYRNKGNFKEAKEMFKKAIEINPENDWAYLGLGWFYRNEGNFKEAKEMFEKAIGINPENDRAYEGLGLSYYEQGKYSLAEEYFRKANKLRLENYNPTTRHNYQKLKEILTQRRIKLVCMQYPMRSVEPLKKMFKNQEGIIFVDNEMVFKKAVQQSGYDEYFTDNFGGDFGHGTRKGNWLLAENIANVMLKEYFGK